MNGPATTHLAASRAPDRADVLLVGGGLANGLIALRLKALRPALKVVVLEREPRVGGRHTWCFFDSDVGPALDWLRPLLEARWEAGYEVRFPRLRRRLGTPYNAVTAERLHAAVAAALGPDLVADARVTALEPERVVLADQSVWTAPLVIDGRGPQRTEHLALGWQKFVGREYRTAAPHGLEAPIVMDATVPQLDGYRFVYSLPLSPDRVMVYDTRYSDGAHLDRAELAAGCDRYAADQGWQVAELLREEDGVLPITLAGDIDAFWKGAELPRVGLRAALFNPVTGYSLPDAVRTAQLIAELPDLNSAAVLEAVEAASKQAWRERGFQRLLNRMLFRACQPERRWVVLERFYRLSQPLIERFYGNRSRLADQARILVGKPPVPIGRAMSVLDERSIALGAKAGGPTPVMHA